MATVVNIWFGNKAHKRLATEKNLEVDADGFLTIHEAETGLVWRFRANNIAYYNVKVD